MTKTLTTDIHSPGGIRTHNFSRRRAADLRLRPRGHWDRRPKALGVLICEGVKLRKMGMFGSFCFCLSLHYQSHRLENISIFSIYPSSTQRPRKTFLGRKNTGRVFAPLAPPPPNLRLWLHRPYPICNTNLKRLSRLPLRTSLLLPASIHAGLIIFPTVQQPAVGQGLLVIQGSQ